MTYPEIEEIRRIEEDRQLQLEEEMAQINLNYSEMFENENIEREKLAEALLEYVLYLKEKQKKEQEEEDNVVIFVNPGTERPVLGTLIKD